MNIKTTMENQQNKNKKVSIIIAAGGASQRLGLNISKQFLLLNNKPLLIHVLEKFQILENIFEVIIVTSNILETKKILQDYKCNRFENLQVVLGGALRQESVYNGFSKLSSECDFVLIHDVARPLFNISDVQNCIELAYTTGTAVLAVPVVDTLKKAKEVNGKIIFSGNNATIDREDTYIVQTPQVYNYNLLLRVYKEFIKQTENKMIITDEARMFELVGKSVSLVIGNRLNFKITYPEDLEIANAVLNTEVRGQRTEVRI